MSKFDDFVDDFMLRAKSAADAAGRKTGEVVEMGKLRYQIKQTQWDIEKTYSKLGAIVYESKKSTENFDEVIELAVNEIDLLSARLESLEERLRACKKVSRCLECGRENDLSHAFCSRCGAPLEFTTQEETPMEAPVEGMGSSNEQG